MNESLQHVQYSGDIRKTLNSDPIMPFKNLTQPSRDKQVSEQNVEIITPLEVRARQEQSDLSRRRSPVKTVSFLLVVLTAIASGGLLFIRHVSENPLNVTKNRANTVPSKTDVRTKLPFDAALTTEKSVGTGTAPAAVPVEQGATQPEQRIDPASLALQKNRAERELSAFLMHKKALDEKGVSQWGGKAYDEMIRFSREADALLIGNDFPAAAEKYLQAAEKAATLTDNTETVFQELMEAGRKALEAGNSDVARQKFRTALMIEPSNGTTQKGLERAEKFDDVKRLIESGRNHEKNNRLSFSLADYHKALNLDPESGPARDGLKRVKERIAGEQFQKFMSDGLTAYHSGNYQDARAKLLNAKSFQPDSSEVREALVMVDEAMRLDSIETLRKAAAGAEQREDWEQALKSYMAVLEIDPNISFAEQGKERSLEQIRVAKRMAFFLTKPDAMESNLQLQNAISLLESAERLRPRGPKLNARLDKLKGLVDAARTPVRVVITSDNFTEVAVYRVGKLGRFAAHELSLRPGTYTLMGSRDGYRDTRVIIRLKPGQESFGVTVVCRDEVD